MLLGFPSQCRQCSLSGPNALQCRYAILIEYAVPLFGFGYLLGYLSYTQFPAQNLALELFVLPDRLQPSAVAFFRIGCDGLE
ncbi:MAG: hypothetical protein IPG32_19380 [Saprospirales bacterium]|nr:hypothetical protein [Saprospirales bacterium]